MGSVIENEKTKEKCQIFTPDDIVKSMLNHLGYSDHLYGKTILESSCGNGQSVKAEAYQELKLKMDLAAIFLELNWILSDIRNA